MSDATAAGKTPAGRVPRHRGPAEASDAADTGSIDTALIDVERIGDVLLGRWKDERLSGRALAGRPELQRDDTLPMAEHRERVLEQMYILAEAGNVHLAYPIRLGGWENHGGNVASYEELVAADPSLLIKCGVQWGLFGAAIMHLGTDAHHDAFLPDVMSLKVPGVFAMTETGHGSDVASIATTATFLPETQEWRIDTPHRAAWKDYLGNAALHGRAAVVFAQLITRGVNHGVHAFYVPIRDDSGALLPGIGSEDDGLKGGLNGVDNGRLHFSDVRVPRGNLLNRYGDVDEDGIYTSPITSPGRRFFTMLSTLVQGRISIGGAANAASKIALQIGVSYANQRRQFPGAGGEETTLLDYGRHQRRLLMRLARTYAIAFGHEQLLRAFHEVFSGEADTITQREDLETFTAGLKAISTWHALDTLQEVREACGGAGFLAENRVTLLRADLDIFATFEGDNTVLLQLVGKRLLGDYAKQFAGADARRMAQIVAGQARGRLLDGTGLRQAGQALADFGSTARSVGRLRAPEVQQELLTARVGGMIADIANRMHRVRDGSETERMAVFNACQHEIIEAATAHTELLLWESFTRALEEFTGPTRQALTWLRDLYGLGLIERDMAWHLINGKLSAQRATSVTRYIDRLLTRLRPHAQLLVDAFGYGPEHLRASIASGAERQRQDEARAHQHELRERGLAPVSERELSERVSPA